MKREIDLFLILYPRGNVGVEHTLIEFFPFNSVHHKTKVFNNRQDAPIKEPIGFVIKKHVNKTTIMNACFEASRLPT